MGENSFSLKAMTSFAHDLSSTTRTVIDALHRENAALKGLLAASMSQAQAAAMGLDRGQLLHGVDDSSCQVHS